MSVYLSGECLGRDDEESGFRINFLEGLEEMCPVNIRYEMNFWADLI